MILGKKQELFAENFGKLILWVYKKGYALRLGEVHRPAVTAAHYAATGRGIKNSAHTRKLAADIFLVKNGQVTWDTNDYTELGVYWKSLHPLNRHGGDFKNRDSVHFSMLHGGVS